MKIYKLLPLVGLFLIVGCDNFLDINDDPNNPTTANLNTILPYTQATLVGSLGFGTAGMSDILGVYNHHTVIRDNHDDYDIQADDFSLTETWDNLYTIVLPDLNAIIARREESPVYSGIAKLMKAYMFTAIVDLWGDMPYTEAGDPVLFKFPHFDDDRAIYTAMFSLVDDGLSDLQAGGIGPEDDDLIYGGDIESWERFGNSLKLNMYNKVRLTDLYNADSVSALLNRPLIETVSDGFALDYNTSIVPENRNPAFVREYAQGGGVYWISPYFYLMMKGEQACQNTLLAGIQDPRIPYYFYNQTAVGEDPVLPVSYRDGEFISIWFGSLNRDPFEGFDQTFYQTLVGLYPVGGPYDDGAGLPQDGTLGLKGASAQRLLTAAAIEYVKAELALTMNTGGDARSLLVNAIRKSFDEVNAVADAADAPLITSADITAYTNEVLVLYDGGDQSKKLEIIMTQKWIQEFGNGLESWNDIRRTGYPQVCDPAQDLNEFSQQTNPYPVVLPYYIGDLTNNGNAPEQHDQYSAKVFWDVN